MKLYYTHILTLVRNSIHLFVIALRISYIVFNFTKRECVFLVGKQSC